MQYEKGDRLETKLELIHYPEYYKFTTHSSCNTFFIVEIQSGVGGPIKEMLVEYRELFDEFKADNLFYHRIKYSGFVVFLSFFMIFAWIPFM